MTLQALTHLNPRSLDIFKDSFFYELTLPIGSLILILVFTWVLNKQTKRITQQNHLLYIGLAIATTDIFYAAHKLASVFNATWVMRVAFFGGYLSVSGSLYLTAKLAQNLGGLINQLLKAAANSEALETAIKTNPNGFAFVSAEPDNFGQFLSVNDQLCKMFGMSRAELIACNFQELTHPNYLDIDLENVRKLLAGEQPSYRLIKLYSRERLTPETDIEATDFWWGDLTVGLLLPKDEVFGKRFLTQIVDINDHVRAATLDALCSVNGNLVYNRRHIMRQVNIDAAAWGRGTQCSLIIFDVDDFKAINEEFNHLGGDEFLREVAARTLDVIRTTDTLARPGGDEFWVLLPGQNIKQAFGVAQRIRAAINEPYTNVIPGQTIRDISVSIGVADMFPIKVPEDAEIPKDDLSPYANELVKAADAAVFEAKRLGKNQVFAATDDVANYWKTLRDINKGLAEHQFVLWYQPIINNRTMLVDGYEALVRWEHPKRGMMFPDEFIHILEDSRSIHELDREVIKMAAERQKNINDLKLNQLIRVNVSPLSLDRDNFLETLGKPILANGTGVEVTELIKLTESAERVLEIIRKNGNKVSLDDLGSGDRSLRQILKVDCIKLDRINLVQDILGETGNICQAIINLAHCLTPSVTVVAEGVETAEQLAELKSMGCDFSQGYYFAKPMPWAEAMAWSIDHNAKVMKDNMQR